MPPWYCKPQIYAQRCSRVVCVADVANSVTCSILGRLWLCEVQLCVRVGRLEHMLVSG